MDKRVSRQYFNDRAATWDETARNNDAVKLQALAGKLKLPAGGWILDVGTGTGVFLPYISSSLNGSSRLVSMDFALNMVAIAKKKQAGQDIKFICAEIESVRFTMNSSMRWSATPHFRIFMTSFWRSVIFINALSRADACISATAPAGSRSI